MILFAVPSEFFSNHPEKVATLDTGIKAVLANVDGLRVVTRNDVACVVSTSGSPEAIVRLQDCVRDNSLGAIELDTFDRTAVRSA